VATLRPGIGIEEIDAGEARVRQAVENLRRVAPVQADIAQPRRLDAGQQLGHAVDEGFAADEIRVRLARRRLDEMLAAAEADFEPRFAARTKGQGLGEVEGQPGQQPGHQFGLMATKRLALRAPVEARPDRVFR
jgi:hypothetical protein